MERHDATNCGLSTREEDDDDDDEHDHDYDDEEQRRHRRRRGSTHTKVDTHALSLSRTRERDTNARNVSRRDVGEKQTNSRGRGIHGRLVDSRGDGFATELITTAPM